VDEPAGCTETTDGDAYSSIDRRADQQDKILQIKASRFQGEALAHVQQELNLLEQVRLEAGISIPEGL
jgi:hypothetical protein